MKSVISSLKPVHWVIIAVAFLGSCTVCGVVGLLVEEPTTESVVVSSPAESVAEVEPTDTPRLTEGPGPTVTPESPCASTEAFTYVNVQDRLISEGLNRVQELEDFVNNVLFTIADPTSEVDLNSEVFQRQLAVKTGAVEQAAQALRGYEDVPDSVKGIDKHVVDLADAMERYSESFSKWMEAAAWVDTGAMEDATADAAEAQASMKELLVKIGDAILSECEIDPESLN